ncbi:MAG: YbhN family protein [Anaerolineales bacterium]
MIYQEEQPKIRLWHYLPILIMLGVAVYLLMPQITILQNSWSVVKSMIWWAVTLAVLMELLSYMGSGFMLHAILDINQQKLSILKGSLIILASTSIGLVAGGWVGSAAATYGWIRREHSDRNTATLAGILPAMLNNSILAGVALIGTIYLLIVHNLSQVQFIEFVIILTVLGFITLGMAVALRFPETVTKLAVRLTGTWAKIRHKPYAPDKIIEWIKQFVIVWKSLHNGKWLRPVLGALANVGFDMLALYFLFIVAGYNINLGILFVGYGLPFILGKMAFLFPGGVGVIEGSMVALYNSLHVPNDISVVVILGYRLLSFWLPTLLGFMAASYLSRKSIHSELKQA